MPYLGLLDTAGIQDFIFRSSRLRHIAAASEYIETLTAPDGWNRGAAGTASGDAASEYIETLTAPAGLFHQAIAGTPVRLIVAAGGNAAWTAERREDLQQAFRTISRTLLEEKRGVEIIGAIVEYSEGRLAETYGGAVRELERRKLTQSRHALFRPAGLAEPALPAPARHRPAPDPQQAIEPDDGDLLVLESEEGEQSGLIGVVSVDGIGMGGRLIQWLAESVALPDDVFRNQFGEWSRSIRQRWKTAWEETIETMMDQFHQDGLWRHPALPRSLRLRENNGIHYRPYRRIYQGGDDLSFVCDARIALAMTALLLARLERPVEDEAVPPLFARMTASAGIVFVDAHFPFSRAAQLAEVTRQGAKKKAVLADRHNPPSVISWWINRQGALEMPEPRFPGATLKPYLLARLPHQGVGEIAWDDLNTQYLPEMWQALGGSRGKLKDLIEAAEQGDAGQSVRRLLRLRPLETGNLLRFVAPYHQPETGFSASGEQTALLDASELFDLHFPFGDTSQ